MAANAKSGGNPGTVVTGFNRFFHRLVQMGDDNTAPFGRIREIGTAHRSDPLGGTDKETISGYTQIDRRTSRDV